MGEPSVLPAVPALVASTQRIHDSKAHLSSPGEGRGNEMESAGLSKWQQPQAESSAPCTAQETPEPELPSPVPATRQM